MTGLKDDFGTPINEGDLIEWTYSQHGVLITNKNGEEEFFPCLTGGEMIVKEFKKTKKIILEVRNDISGYFLDRPSGISTTFIKNKPKCKVI